MYVAEHCIKASHQARRVPRSIRPWQAPTKARRNGQSPVRASSNKAAHAMRRACEERCSGNTPEESRISRGLGKAASGEKTHIHIYKSLTGFHALSSCSESALGTASSRRGALKTRSARSLRTTHAAGCLPQAWAIKKQLLESGSAQRGSSAWQTTSECCCLQSCARVF